MAVKAKKAAEPVTKAKVIDKTYIRNLIPEVQPKPEILTYGELLDKLFYIAEHKDKVPDYAKTGEVQDRYASYDNNGIYTNIPVGMWKHNLPESQFEESVAVTEHGFFIQEY